MPFRREAVVQVAGILGVAALLLVLGVSRQVVAAGAESSDDLQSIKKELEVLKQGQEQLQKDLEEIKALLKTRRNRQADSDVTNVVLSVTEEPFKGEANSPVTIVEFSDYQCPFCGRYFVQTFPQLEREYIASGKVKYVFRDFPIERIHPQALKAAVAANCAGKQGKYWPMHDRLFSNQKDLGVDGLKGHAESMGLDIPAFEACFNSEAQEGEIKEDMAEAVRAGVRGTPTFFLGLTNPEGSQFTATLVLRGAQPFPRFKQAIDGLLTKQGMEGVFPGQKEEKS